LLQRGGLLALVNEVVLSFGNTFVGDFGMEFDAHASDI
jgi:hypothetical protein